MALFASKKKKAGRKGKPSPARKKKVAGSARRRPPTKNRALPGKKAARRGVARRNLLTFETAGAALQALGALRQKNPKNRISIRIKNGGVLHGKNAVAFLRRHKGEATRNVQMGYYDGGSFHPIRASIDYSPAAVGESFSHAPTSRSAARLMKKRRAEQTRAAGGQRSLPFVNPGFSRVSGRVDLYGPLSKSYSSLEALREDVKRVGMKAAWRVVKGETIVDVRTQSGKIVAVYRGVARNGTRSAKKTQRNSPLLVLANGKKAKRKRNSAGDEFHGYDLDRSTHVNRPDSAPGVIDQLGPVDYFYYRVDGEHVKTDGDDEGKTAHKLSACRIEGAKLQLASNSQGDQYYVVSTGDLRLFEPNKVFGPLTRVDYRARKPHLNEGSMHMQKYFHPFGDENGKRPTLRTDKEGCLIISGGDYRTNRFGINN